MGVVTNDEASLPPELGRYVVISSDTHAGPQLREYRDHVDPQCLVAFDEYVAEREEKARAYLHEASMVASFAEAPDLLPEQLAAFASHPTLQPGGAPGLRDAEYRLRDLDAQGIAGEVIYPDFTASNDPPWGALGGGRRPGATMFASAGFYAPELVRAGCRAWNRWLAGVCAQAPARRAGIAVVPIHDVDAAVEEVRWAHEAGLRGGIILPGQSPGLPGYHDPVYDPIWSTCEEYGMPLNVHVGNDLPDYGARPEAFALSQTEMLFFGHRALWFLMWGGVFERHPNLFFTLAEQDCYWVPQTLRELEAIFDSKFAGPGLRSRLSHRPTEYWARQCFVAATVMSRPEAERRHEIGLENIMWGSDYPHLESSWPYTQLVLRNTFHGLPEDDVRAMLGGNAARAYGFDLDELGAVAARVCPPISEVDHSLTADEMPRDYIGEGFRCPVNHTEPAESRTRWS